MNNTNQTQAPPNPLRAPHRGETRRWILDVRRCGGTKPHFTAKLVDCMTSRTLLKAEATNCAAAVRRLFQSKRNRPGELFPSTKRESK